MPRKKNSRRGKRQRSVPVVNPNAGGIDVGATEIFVAVPPDRDPDSVRSFPTFTQDLQTLAQWLLDCGVSTVAMESTSVYWIPLFTILEERGIEVCLVNARHLKKVPGRKTDVLDCEWLQYLHSVGLLRGSFHPPTEVAAVRTVLRHRTSLVQMASSHVQHIQKALTQMNLQIHHVISDITGKTGLAILDAILAGERRPQVLAQLRDPRIRADKKTIAKALVGTWRPEHLFTLRQSLATYRTYQAQIAECEEEIRRMLASFDSEADPDNQPLPPATKKGLDKGMAFDLRSEFYRILGTDLTAVPGLQVTAISTLFSECGDLSAFPDAGQFASWLGLCPDNRISGGKVLSAKTRKVDNRAATTLRMAAQTLHRHPSHLGEFYRRMRYRLGAPKAITATAHKLARIIYHLVTNRQPYDESIFLQHDHLNRKRKTRRLLAQAQALGLSLVPASAPEGVS
jgi:transposase